MSKNFRLVMHIQDRVHQLLQGELEGIRGISSSGWVVTNFLVRGRDSVLLMPQKEVIRLNKLERFQYDNPEFWMRDDMVRLKRLSGDMGEESMWGYLRDSIGLTGIKRTDTPYYYAFSITNMPRPKVNSVRELATEVLRNLKAQDGPDTIGDPDPADIARFKQWQSELNVGEVSEWVRRAILDRAAVFKKEDEWAVEDSHLKVPRGSTVFLKPEISRFEPKLSSRYQVIILPDHVNDVLKGIDKIRKRKRKLSMAY